jgi:hypothetical protein
MQEKLATIIILIILGMTFKVDDLGEIDLYSKIIQGRNQGTRRVLLMKKHSCQKSRASAPLTYFRYLILQDILIQ